MIQIEGRKQSTKINYNNTGLITNHKSANSKPTLKRTNTMKLLSPKGKGNKNYMSHK